MIDAQTEAGQPAQEPTRSPKPNPHIRLFRYLMGEKTIKGGPDNFPEAFDLGAFESELREAHLQRPEGSFFDEQTRKKMAGEDNGAAEGIDDRLAAITGEAESTMAIYLDPEDGEIKTASGTDLKPGEVWSKVPELMQQGKLPLLDTHTHSSESLLSIEDLDFLIMGDPERGHRALYATMILCPKSQVLAVATEKTPILAPPQGKAVIEDWAKKHEQGESVRRLAFHQERSSRIDKIGHEMLRKLDTRFIERYRRAEEEYLTRLEQDWTQRDDAQQELDQTMEHSREKYDSEASAVNEKSGRISQRAFGKYLKVLKESLSRTQLEFVREMGIKLYVSTDFRHFTALPDTVETS